MNLETEDVFPQGDTLATRPVETTPPSIHPAALFAPRPTAVPVIVKRRRLPGSALPTPTSAPESAAPDDERRPRVFVLPKEGPAEPAPAAEPLAANPAGDDPAPRRLRRRRPALHRPSPVLHIVPPPPEPPAEAPAVDPADDSLLPRLPAVDEYRALQAALQGVRALVDDAHRASRFNLRPFRTR